MDAPRLVGAGIAAGGTSGTPVPLHCAGFPYWELASGRWRTALDSALELGVRVLRVDVPWSLHEPARGAFEWGARHPQLDLARLLELIDERGQLALIRPGPWLPGAPDGGLPHWVASLPEVCAHDGAGAELPLPSAASELFWELAGGWLGHVHERVAEYAAPAGPVAGWIATAIGPLPAPWGGGALDWSTDALAFCSRFASVKYPRARAPVGRPPAAGPRREDELEHSTTWVEAGEAVQRTALTRVLEAQSGLPRFAEAVDSPAGSGPDPRGASPADGVFLRLDPAGARDFAALRRLGMRAGGLPPLAGVSGVPTGEPLLARSDLPPVTAAAVLWMSGARALDLDSLWPRAGERSLLRATVGEPLSVDGALREQDAADWRELLRQLDAIGHTELARRTDCLLLENRELARLREACARTGALDPRLGPPGVLEALRVVPRDLGTRDRPELDGDIAFTGLLEGLRSADFATGLADTSISEAALEGERVVLLVSFERMSRPLAGRLLAWVRAGGTLVLGPRLPALDWSGEDLRLGLPFEVKERVPALRLGGLELEEVDLLAGAEPLLWCDAGVLAASAPLGAGRLVHFGFRLPWRAAERDPAELAHVLESLLTPFGVTPRYPASERRVETELWESDVRRFLFLANPGPPCSVTVRGAPREALREVRGRGEYVRAGESLPLPARSVSVREVVPL